MDIRRRLQCMSFLQYFIWGSWVVTLGAYLIRTLGFNGSQVGAVYSSKGLAALLMPALLGLLADRFVAAHRLYALCHGLSALTLFWAADIRDADTLFWVMALNMMCFMPTLALSNTISYFCLDRHRLDTVAEFPAIRVFGTMGFIAAMWTVSLLGLELSHRQLQIAGTASLLLAAYALTLPEVTPARDGRNPDQSLRSRLGLDALALLAQPRMAVFFLFAMLLGVVLQITGTFGNPFLHDFAAQPAYRDSLVVRHPSLLLSVSQLSEIAFILSIPFFLKRFGIKTVMLISMLAWALRFGFFAFGNPSAGGMVLLLLSMVVYGCAFDFFNISGSIFIEQEFGADTRASAQGLFMTVVNGLGAFAGARLSGWVVDSFTTAGVRDWQSIWLVFAGYTLLLAGLFALAFRPAPAPSAAQAPRSERTHP